MPKVLVDLTMSLDGFIAIKPAVEQSDDFQI
jgi:hypothetical protein